MRERVKATGSQEFCLTFGDGSVGNLGVIDYDADDYEGRDVGQLMGLILKQHYHKIFLSLLVMVMAGIWELMMMMMMMMMVMMMMVMMMMMMKIVMMMMMMIIMMLKVVM